MDKTFTGQNLANQNLTGDKSLTDTNVSDNLSKINREAKEREYQEKALKMGLSYIDISKTPINPDLLNLISAEQAKSAEMMPFFRIGKKIRVTVAHPTSPATQAVLKSLTEKGYTVSISLSTPDAISEAIALYSSDLVKVKKEIDTSLNESALKAYQQEINALKDLKNRLPSLPAEESLYLINVGALKTGASDIHIEPEEKFIRLRFRIDGLMRTIFEFDRESYVKIANQIKYQAKLKLNVTNIPQDGRYGFLVNERKVDLRVSSLPTEYGETFVCRLLDSKRHLATFEELGFWGRGLKKIQKVCGLSHGMVLVTGPTGSGKTTTLYTLLSKFNSPDAKIITLEDPIEYHLEGISQSQINESRDYTFASGLRAILRQDPNIVMIGEVRDQETAEVAAQAALTGHVLLSTLHTNSAIETIPRLINIGLPSFMVAPALNTIVAQRLVRTLCQNCKQQVDITKSDLDQITKTLDTIKKVDPSIDLTIPDKLYKAVGCEICSKTGYKGRIGLVEMVEIDYEMRELILNKSSEVKLIESARKKGFVTMKEDGVIKVIKGLTSLEEVYRVTSIIE